jgi:hypothetical protein
MPTYHTGSWTIETRDDGRVVDLTSSDPGLVMNAGMKERVIATVNADVADGIAPSDVATWGYEYRNHTPRGSEAFFWASYLSTVRGAIDDGGVPEEKRRSGAKTLEQTIRDLINHNKGAGRIRGYGGWRPPVGTTLRDRDGRRFRVEEHVDGPDPHIALRVLGTEGRGFMLARWHDMQQYTPVHGE